MSIVSNSRTTVAARRSAYLFIRGLLAIAAKVAGTFNRVPSRFVAVPAFGTQAELADFLNRLGCAFPGGASCPDVVVALTRGSTCVPTLAEMTSNLPEAQAPFLSEGLISKLRIVLPSDLTSMYQEQDSVVLVHKISELAKPSRFGALSRAIVVDPTFYLAFEPYNYAVLAHRCASASSRSELRDESLRKFRSLRGQLGQRDDAVVLVTGPSVEEAARKIKGLHATVVVCNSIVKNVALMDEVQPDILVFSDAVFHLGASRYAEEFRHAARAALARFPNLHCVVSEVFYPFVRAHFPAFRERIIGLPQYRGRDIGIPTEGSFSCRITDNIMTSLMMPLAISLARNRILIGGADGRQKGEQYYWKHNPSTQFADLMDSAFATHPSFTRDRVYEDYYEKHCALVERFSQVAEKQNKAVISLTPSYIPALERRYSSSGTDLHPSVRLSSGRT